MKYQFEYLGGVDTIQGTSCCKFLCFNICNGKEIPFYECKKQNILTKVQSFKRGETTNNNTYSIELPIIKIFIFETEMFKPRIIQSFYLKMGDNDENQTVTIKPTFTSGVTKGFYFKSKAKFLSKKESLSILDATSVSYKMLLAQSPLPIDTLRSLVSITRPKVIEQARKVRKLRFG